MSISPDDTGYLTVPALPDGYAYWMCNGRHFTPGQQLTYDSLDDWMWKRRKLSWRVTITGR